MRTPVQAQPVTRALRAAKLGQGDVNASQCLTATCTAGGECCANIPVIGQVCMKNPLPIGGSGSCCLEGFFPPKVCCSLNGTRIGCF